MKGLSPSADAVFDFKQSTRQLAHLSRPWQTFQRDVAGTFMVAGDASAFYQMDSTKFGRAVYSSFAFCCDTTLAIISYGEKEPSSLTFADKRDFLYDISAMTPAFLLKEFLLHGSERSFLRYVPGSLDSVVYTADDGKIITLAIDPGANELRSVNVLYSHEMYGDVVKTTSFGDYTASEEGHFRYPRSIVQHELGFDASVVSVSLSRESFDKGRIMAMIPATYHLKEDSPKPTPEIVRTDYNERIHLLDLKHADEKVLVVEFKDYLLVAEAPRNSANGEMILDKAREIAPGKPVRYFAFGHYHPAYLGGVRAFVHRGATVLSMPGDTEYVRQLTTFRHSLDPDSLELQPRALKLEMLDSERVVSDGEMEMRIIHIGAMSHHTDDYLIYYFPKEKLLFEDDLVWIARDKPLAAAGASQRGLYDAIMLHHLDVDTILQGWPVKDYGVKTTLDFKELRQSVEMATPKK